MSGIVVVGSVAYDDVETPAGRRERTLGGSATHFSVSASFFNPVRLVGVVGGDFEREHISFLQQREICLKGLQIMEGGKTFHWSGRYGDDLNSAESLRTDLNVFSSFHPVLPTEYRDEKFLFLANIDPDLQLDVLSQMKQVNWVACDTMNFWIETKSEQLKATLRKVKIVLMNEGEARLFTGERNIICAAKAIMAMGPEILVIKRGEYGALLFHQGDVFAAPALPLESVVDPTGAGDAFAGGFLGYLARSNQLNTATLKQAMICGSVMASFQVQDFSLDRMRRLNFKDIQERYSHFQELAHFHGPLA